VRSSPWTDWGGDGPTLHLAHANGFPPEAYATLIRCLVPSFHVVTSASRPLWPSSRPETIASWAPLADDLADALERHGVTSAIGVGHSLGGVLSAWAAAANPRLFSRLVLIDPVLFAGVRARVWGWARRLGLASRLPLVRITRRRRDRFPDLEAARTRWQRRSVFRSWDPRCFDDYVRAAFVPHADGGIALRYPKAWEARVFELSPHDPWSRMHGLDLPLTALAGENTDTFLSTAARRLEREVPGARVEVVPGTSHFLPFERPDEVARRIVTATIAAD
jgi:pimeloyl-ACP methyl ester carboxylesterase